MAFRPCPRGHDQENGTTDGSTLCDSCVTRVEGHLRALPELHQECLHQVSPTARRTNPTKVSASRSRDHLDIAALDTRHHIRAILESWSGMVVDTLGTTPPPRTVPHLARFLREHLQWLTTQPPAVEFADEIEGLVAELRQAVDPDPSDVRTLARKCVVDGCDGSISAVPLGGAGAGGALISCSTGHSWGVREWPSLRKLMERQRKGVDA